MSSTYFKLITTDRISGYPSNKSITLTANAGSMNDGQTISLHVSGADTHSYASINMTKDEALRLAFEIMRRFEEVSATGYEEEVVVDNREERRERNNWK